MPLSDKDNLHRIAIVGGGAGGLALAARLGRKFRRDPSTEILLLDKTPTHLWKPLLHEVATGSLDSHHDQVSYINLARKHGFRFLLGELAAIDASAKTLSVKQISTAGELPTEIRKIDYDQAVLAIGSLSNDFGTRGVAQHAHMLDHQIQAEKFHQLLVTRLHQTNREVSDTANQSDGNDPLPELAVTIVGGGATGVELAADLHNVATQLESFGFTYINPETLSITVLEAGPRLLAQLPERISHSVLQELGNIGVDVHTDTLVTEVTEAEVHTQDGKHYPADLCVWAAGIRAPEILADSGLETDKAGRVITTRYLNLEAHPDTFFIGDCGHCPMDTADGSEASVPPRAQSAHQMCGLTYKNLLRQRKNQALKAFRFQDYGSLVSLSEYSTVGSLMGNLMRGTLFVEGALARLIYRALYRRHQMAVHGMFATGLIMIGDRIHEATHSHLKLH
ncbi:MAG: NAD(P)/FAD-dependent oxidoreductase [Gammaproteobacteria bacterium]|nr:NAD(P)/FAD-dependent oxidoreductase [Gammaproteobacteria bacterium]